MRDTTLLMVHRRPSEDVGHWDQLISIDYYIVTKQTVCLYKHAASVGSPSIR